MPVPSVPGRVDAVKEVNPAVHCFQDIRRSPNPHQISRFILRQMRNDRIQDAVHILMALSHGKAAHRITIQIQLCDLPGMRDADILVDPALVDPKQELMGIDRVRQRVLSSALDYSSHPPELVCGTVCGN